MYNVHKVKPLHIMLPKTSAYIKSYDGLHKVKSLQIMLPKTSAYVKSYDGQTKWMYFLILIIRKI